MKNKMMKNVMARVSIFGLVLALTTMVLAACAGNQGECTYDTDCPTLGYTCDPESHRCIRDPEYDRKTDGLCNSDLDCDPVMQRCEDKVCVAVHINPTDGGPDGGGDDGGVPPACEGLTPDCSSVGLPGQGRDVDGDLWGECCDCNDADALTHPGRTELIYNRKDDDCNPATSDGDVDGDGHDSVLVDGSDCDDRNASVFPGALETCDGIDNDCNGLADDNPDCEAPDGGDYGGPDDDEPDCPDISGIYNILAYCLQISDAENVELIQNGCDLAFNLDAIYCTGAIDGALNMYIECAGLGFPCTAKASLTLSFTVICSQQCSFIFEPVDTGTACTFHSDTACTQDNKLCGVVGENGSPTTVCVETIPGGRQPGYYCNEGQDIYCANSLCLDGTCAGICADNVHCSAFDGTSCQTIAYNDGQGTVGNIQACGPENTGETRCGRTTDCSISRVCSYRQTADDVVTLCRQPNPGGGAPGDACTTGSDCENNLCICGDVLCDGGAEGTCSAVCENSADCIQSSICGSVYVPDLGGTDRLISACIPDPDSCGRNADCPVGKSCQVWQEDMALVTQCWYGAGPATDNTGEPCANDTNCFSVWCDSVQNFCLGVCINDSDCPDYDSGGGACADDDACTLEQLCEPVTCVRPFECATHVFFMGFDEFGGEVFDTANLCRPQRRDCELNSDCRAGEACSLANNKTATAAGFSCFPGFGPGQLGDDCYAGGSASCWTGLCLLVGGGGPGAQYCSEACVTAADCGDVGTWDCQAIRVDVRPGFVSYIPACILR